MINPWMLPKVSAWLNDRLRVKGMVPFWEHGLSESIISARAVQFRASVGRWANFETGEENYPPVDSRLSPLEQQAVDAEFTLGRLHKADDEVHRNVHIDRTNSKRGNKEFGRIRDRISPGYPEPETVCD